MVSGDVEANDTDVDGDTLTVTQFVVGASTVTVDPITGGSISLTEGDLTINATARSRSHRRLAPCRR